MKETKLILICRNEWEWDSVSELCSIKATWRNVKLEYGDDQAVAINLGRKAYASLYYYTSNAGFSSYTIMEAGLYLESQNSPLLFN